MTLPGTANYFEMLLPIYLCSSLPFVSASIMCAVSFPTVFCISSMRRHALHVAILKRQNPAKLEKY